MPFALVACGTGLALIAGAATGPSSRGPVSPPIEAKDKTIDPKADEILKRMGKDLGALQGFRFTGDSATEVVLENGQKIEYDATSQVAVQRPAGIRSERKGTVAHLVFTYDGQQMTLLGTKANLYATSTAPPKNDEAIDFARKSLGLDFPGADLLASDPYKSLMEDVQSGTYVGESEVEGVPCDQVAFRTPDVDFQVWVEKGKVALPRKFTIVSTHEPASPEYSVVLRDWDTKATFPKDYFHFQPPKDAARIDFMSQHEAGSGGDVGGGGQ